MKPKLVRYERLYNLGNFDHEKIAIEIEVEEGETATEALKQAKKFCRVHYANYLSQLVKVAKRVIEDKKHFYDDMSHEEAESILAEHEGMQAELPL